MYIVNDICYADAPVKENKVIECKPLEGEMLLLTFSNMERKLFDCTKLKGTAFLPLQEKTIFNNVQLFHGFPTWDDGNIDIAPEVLYAEGIPYNDFEPITAVG